MSFDFSFVTPSSQSGMVQHHKYWFDDGNIIFRFDKKIIMCLHRGILATQSVIFQDMLSIPQPDDPDYASTSSAIVAASLLGEGSSQPAKSGDEQEFYNGLPVIDLHDPLEDFESFLSFIYPTSLAEMTRISNKTYKLATLMPVIRLANKYMVDELRDWGLRQFTKELPRDLSGLEHLKSQSPESIITTIQLCRANKLFDFLPLQFYALVTYKWEAQQEKMEEYLKAISALDREDQMRLLVGRAELQKAVFALARARPDHCALEERPCKNPRRLRNSLGQQSTSPTPVTPPALTPSSPETPIVDHDMSGPSVPVENAANPAVVQSSTVMTPCTNGPCKRSTLYAVGSLENFLGDPLGELQKRSSRNYMKALQCTDCQNAYMKGCQEDLQTLFKKLGTIFNL